MSEPVELYVIRCEDTEGGHRGYLSGFAENGTVLLTNSVGRAEIVGYSKAAGLVSRLQRSDPTCIPKLHRLF
jgi:hypothetical protein